MFNKNDEMDIRESLLKYHLEGLSPEYFNNIENLNVILKPGLNKALQGECTYLEAIVQQNFLIIRLLNDINKKLDK